MDTQSEPITIHILDREYQFMCKPDERAALKEAAELLDGRMREIKSSGNLMALERIAVMTALNMSDEILKLRQQGLVRQERLDNRIKMLADEIDDALAGGID